MKSDNNRIDTDDFGWVRMPSGIYTATPDSTSVILMSDTSDFAVGMGARYTWNSNQYFGIVTAINANVSITIAGPTLAIGGGANDLTELSAGPGKAFQVDYFFGGTYGDDTGDKLATDMNAYSYRGCERLYMAQFGLLHKTDDTTTQPKFNMKIAGQLVSTNDSNNGIQASTSLQWNSAVAINTSNYDWNRGEAIEGNVTVKDADGISADLSVFAIMVAP